MKKKHFVIATVFLCVINITALATFSYNRWIRPKSMDVQQESFEPLQVLRSEMRLTPQQMERMQGRRLSFEREIASLRENMQEAKDSLVKETRKPSPDLDRIDAIIEEYSRLQASIQKRTMRNLLKDRELLNPQQQKKYFSLFEDHMRGIGRRQRARGRGKGGPRWRKESQQDKRIQK
jgi:Spy/CpxP family protein refolding chaperone